MRWRKYGPAPFRVVSSHIHPGKHMLTKLHNILALVAAMLLSACGGGGPQHLAETTAFDHTAATIQLDINPPTSLEVSCFFGRCFVEWSGQHGTWDNVRIYRSTTNDPSTSAEIERLFALSILFVDGDVEEGKEYYYWARFEQAGTGELSDLTGPAFDAAHNARVAAIAQAEEALANAGKSALSFPREESDSGFRPERAYLLANEVLQAPVYQDGKYLYVGIDQGRDVLETLAKSGPSASSSSATTCTNGGCSRLSTSYRRTVEVDERDNWTIRRGEMEETRVLNGVQQGLRSYFDNTAQLARLGVPVVMRFETVPTVRFGGAVSSTDVGRLTTVLQIINAALPGDSKLEMATGTPEAKPSDLAGAIYVEFLPQSEYRTAVGHSSIGQATTSYSPVDARIDHAHIQINRTYADKGETEAALVLAHELLHSLGIGHAIQGMKSMMTATLPASDADLPLPLLYRDDRRALNALYSDMTAGTSVTSLGEWDDTVTHLAANNDWVAFGIAYADGYGEPWAYGYRPGTDLADNPRLRGTASWSGMLLGFTSDEKPLSGKTALSVQLRDLTGTADFTELETWGRGSMPGEFGQGTDWSGGDLSYDILVTRNTFRQIGGDEGQLTGAFFGDSHESMGGTLHRDDLSAAFGGVRNDLINR